MAPKYQFIADSLRQEIESGLYREKGLLPTEQMLCRHFNISRQTVRRALAILEGEGLIVRRQGSGSHLREHVEPERAHHYSIAVLTTYISDYIFPHILRGVESVLTANGTYPELGSIPSVLADNCSGGRMLVEHLYRKGHQNIAGIFKSDDMQGHQRYLGYAQALKDLGLPMEDKHVFWYNTEHREFLFRESYLDQMLRLLRGEACQSVSIPWQLIEKESG